MIDICAFGIAALALLLVSDLNTASTTASVIEALRRVGVTLALGSGRVQAEPAGKLADSFPVSHTFMWTTRLVLLIALMLALWAGLLWIVRVAIGDRRGEVPIGDLTIEFLAIVGLMAFVSDALRRRLNRDVAAALAPVALLGLLALIVMVLPDALTLLPVEPGDPRWEAAHLRWIALLLALAAALWFMGRDPGRVGRPQLRIASAKRGRSPRRLHESKEPMGSNAASPPHDLNG